MREPPHTTQDAADDPPHVAPDRDWTGVRVGAYAVGRQIGVGGMGAVYEAVRVDDEFRKRVAIKLLRPGVEGELAVRRLRYERQILANLSHRNIAALLDGGTTPEGQPYLVMELVDGAPITQWCDARRLTVRARVALFRQVCDAVRHAHQHLVVHRDLKPGNILVAADGTVKLLDFGIARLLREQDGVDTLPPTRVELRVWTPEYASPEQLRGLPVSTASDVYALGAVLHELLVGRAPLELDGLDAAEVERVVCEEPPPRPSTVLRDDRWRALGERSHRRACERIAGDLDAIVLMALRKEPDRRYGSAEQLDGDLHRHLAGMPVTARPDSAAYRLRRFVRRHRLPVAAALLVLVTLAGGMASVMAQTRRATLERERGTEVTRFLTGMLGGADPASRGRDVTVREVVDSAAAQADSLRPWPALEAEVRAAIASTYFGLGEYEAAEAQNRLGLAAHRRVAPRGDYATATALSRIASTLEHQGRLEEADSLLGEAAAMIERFPPPTEIDVADFLDARARVLNRLGRTQEARQLLEEALAITLVAAAQNDSAIAYAYNNLAVVVSEIGDNAAAETLFVAAAAAARRAYGHEHTLVAAIMSAHASERDYAGDLVRADSMYRAVLDMRRRLLGPEHPEYAWTMFNYADHLVRRERWSEAAYWSRQVLALRGRSLPEAHPGIGVAMQVLGRALGPMDSLDAAEHWLRESMEFRRATVPEGHWLLSSSESVLGEHYVLAGRYVEAERLLLPAERRLVELRGERAHVVDDVRARIVKLYTAWARPAEAARWQARRDAVKAADAAGG